MVTDTTIEETAEERKKRLARERKQRQRERLAEAGVTKVEIQVTAEEAELLAKLKELQKGNPDTFLGRALLMGAKFLANSGQPKGQKVKGGAK